MKGVLKKAYSIYKEIDEIIDQDEDKFIDAVDKIPLNRVIDTEPTNSVRETVLPNINTFVKNK